MNAMSLLTRGYICPVQNPDEGTVIGKGPTIVDRDDVVPVIIGGKVDPPPHVCPPEDDD